MESLSGSVCPEGSLCVGVSVKVLRGSLSRGSLSRGCLSRGCLSRGSLSRGVSVQGSLSRRVSVQGGLSLGGLSLGVSCSGGFYPGGLCPGGLSPGESLSERPPDRDPHTVTSAWYASYWNEFLFREYFTMTIIAGSFRVSLFIDLGCP